MGGIDQAEIDATTDALDDSGSDGQEAPTTAGPRRPWRQALAADLRAAIPDFSVSLGLTGVFMLYIWWKVDIESSEMVKFFPASADGTVFWDLWLLNAVGWAAMLWAWATTILGLLVAGQRPTWLPGSTRTIEKLHRTTSLSTIALTLIHILVLVEYQLRHKDVGVGQVLAESFVPLLDGWGVWDLTFWGIAVAGLGAFYIAILLGLSYYIRHMVGVRAWRFAHRFSIIVYAMAAWHTFIYSAEIWFNGYQRTVFWLMQVPIAVLVLTRLLAPLRRRERLPLRPTALLPQLDVMAVLRLGVRLVAAATILVLASILIRNDTGGRLHADHYPTREEIDQSAEDYFAEYQG
jgi:methionine sulfoxide reductase heme-binding subunit